MEPKDVYTTIEKQGNITVLTTMTRANRTARVKKISKDEYINLGTGEVCEFDHKENRSMNSNSLRRSFNEIRGIVNANGTNPKYLRFVTLTYSENMTDPKRLYEDFRRFWQRFAYYHDKGNLPKPKYLLVVEPQERGAWHGHMVLFYETRAPFIPNEDLERIWGHGFTKVAAVDDVDNVGAYLSAYLTNAIVDADDEDEDTVEVDGVKKAVIKGGRLHMYPTGMKIYRCSKGLKKPEKSFISSAKADEFRQKHKTGKTFEVEREFKDPKTGFKTYIIKEWYNKMKEGL